MPISALLLVLALSVSVEQLARLRVTPPSSTTFTAASCSRADVNAVLNGPTHTAVEGDTIVIPGTPCTWTSGVSVPAGVTVKGTGTPSTDPAVVGPSASCTQTEITLSGTVIPAFTQSATYGAATSRISCMEIIYEAAAVAVGIAAQGTCTASGCPNLRWDNLTFTNWAGHISFPLPANSYGVNAVSNFFGVIDHNALVGNDSSFLHLLEIGLPSYLGVGAFGDNDWAQAENFGSANFLFVENNALSRGAGLSDNETQVVENGGGRIVARFNTFTDQDHLNYAMTWHGTESNGRERSVHAFEFYQNTFSCKDGVQCGSVLYLRDGTGLVWGNTVNNPFFMDLFLASYNFRSEGGTGGWTACDGSTVYDTNDGVTYFSGTVASGGGTATIAFSPDPGWDVNEWATAGTAYSVHNVTQGNGHIITANTANTLTILNQGGPGAFYDQDGDSIQILRATACLDQFGRGSGRLYSGNPASPSSAADQGLIGAYVWMTTLNGGAFLFGIEGVGVNPDGRFLRNRDYYNETLGQTAQSSASAPFDGTTTIGAGHGTLARRPVACTTGVIYFAIDQGSWNAGTNPSYTGQGRRYKCTAPNTWTLDYTPYIYPNPLTVTP